MVRTKLILMASTIAVLLALGGLTGQGPSVAGGPFQKGQVEAGKATGPVPKQEMEAAQSKAQEIAPNRARDLDSALKGRAAPGVAHGFPFPPPRQGGVTRGFVSVVGSFELTGPTGIGLYRWLEYPNDRFNPYRFWRSDLSFESRESIFFGGGGSNPRTPPRQFIAHLYQDIRYPFWLAFSERPNPDGTYNIAFSLDRRSWYWWDDDARGFDLTLALPPAVPAAQP